MESKVDCLVAASKKPSVINDSNVKKNVCIVLDQPVHDGSAVISDEFLHLRDHMKSVARIRTDIIQQVNYQSQTLQQTISCITNPPKSIEITDWPDARVEPANGRLGDLEEVLLMMPRTLQGIRRQIDKEGAMHMVMNETIFNLRDLLEHG